MNLGMIGGARLIPRLQFGVDRGRASPLPRRLPPPIDQRVVGDAVKPVLERGRSAVGRKPPGRADESLLGDVISLGFNKASPVGESVNHSIIAVEKKLERTVIAGLGAANQFPFRYILVLYPHSVFAGTDDGSC